MTLLPITVLLLAAAGWRADNLADAAASLQRRDFRAAAAEAEAGLQSQPRSVDLWNLLGIAQSELGNVRAAETAFTRGLAIAPQSVPLNENAGLLFFKLRDYVRAKERLARAVAAGSNNPSVRYSLAAARLRTGEADRARSDLAALETALGNVAEYWEERGRADLPVDPKTAENYFLRARTLSSDSPGAWNGAAAAAEAQGSEERALAYLIEFRKRQPNDVPTLIHFADLCIRRDLGPDALDALEKARVTQPGNQSILFLLARANISVGNWESARALFLQFLRKNASYAPALYATAWVDGRLNRRDEARQYLDKALKAEPKYADALCDRAQMEVDAGETAAAARDVASALAVDAGHVKANLLAGDLRLRSDDLAAARTHYERALETDRTSASGHYKLSVVLNRQGEKTRSADERMVAANLAEQDKKRSKTQLRLLLPREESR